VQNWRTPQQLRERTLIGQNPVGSDDCPIKFEAKSLCFSVTLDLHLPIRKDNNRKEKYDCFHDYAERMFIF